jgi:hypothetical protein
MAEREADDRGPAGDAQPSGHDRPAPPPYRPNRYLIGYIEQGQQPVSRPARPPEE